MKLTNHFSTEVMNTWNYASATHPPPPPRLLLQGVTETGCFIVLQVKRGMSWMFAGVRVAFYLSAWKLAPSVSRIESNKSELLKDTVNA
jgi:hypothetical protein